LAEARLIRPVSSGAIRWAHVRLETLVGVAAGAAAARAFAALPAGMTALVGAFLAAVLVVLAAIDLERRIIPNRIVLPALAIVLVARMSASPGRTGEWIGAAGLAIVVLMLPRLIDPAAIGMGDVKLAALIGAALGWTGLIALAVGFASTLPVAGYVIAKRGIAARKTALPLGPFLAFGALILMFIPYGAGLAPS
jgi:leader peptidase (prepilin peptidase) / N-methyltransferase